MLMKLVLLLVVLVHGQVYGKSLDPVEVSADAGLDLDLLDTPGDSWDINIDFDPVNLTDVPYTLSAGGRVKRQVQFEHAKDWIKANVPALIKKIKIPDYKKKKFWYSYSLTGAKVTGYSVPSITFSNVGNDIIANANGGHISAQGNYYLRFTFIKSRGTVKVDIRNVNLRLRGYYDGKIHIKSCSGSLGSLNVKISNRILNLFRKYLERPLKRGLERKLCEWTKRFP